MDLIAFFETIAEDPRITTTHICLYLALVYTHELASQPAIFRIDRMVLMQLAKINARSTYDRVMHDLNAFGYIIYLPSYAGNSRVQLKKI
jgi:hypothetical protein